jgi:sec-independent protein translocase protein TatA
MFGLGTTELVVIFIIILLLFGAKRLPELARGMGKSVNEFKKAKDEFEREVQREIKEADPTQPRVKEASGKESADV